MDQQSNAAQAPPRPPNVRLSAITTGLISLGPHVATLYQLLAAPGSTSLTQWAAAGLTSLSMIGAAGVVWFSRHRWAEGLTGAASLLLVAGVSTAVFLRMLTLAFGTLLLVLCCLVVIRMLEPWVDDLRQWLAARRTSAALVSAGGQ